MAALRLTEILATKAEEFNTNLIEENVKEVNYLPQVSRQSKYSRILFSGSLVQLYFYFFIIVI